MRCRDLPLGIFRPARRRAGFRSIDIAEQAMGRGSHFLWRRPCGKDGKIGIDLAGVGVDDDGVLPPGELQCQSALAAGGRSGNKRHSRAVIGRSEEHTSELQSLMRISYAVFCLKKKKYTN